MRAAARELVRLATDRRNRHVADDFGGRISNAMAEAYRQGMRDAALIHAGKVPEDNPDVALNLMLLSQQARERFCSVAGSVFGGPGQGPLTSEPKGYLHWVPPNPPEAPEERWVVAIVTNDGTVKYEDNVAGSRLSRKAVSPWTKYGLVEAVDAGRHRFLSERAFLTWCEFLRSDREYMRWPGMPPDNSGYVPPE